ncbi:MAG: GGDEF domain-containing protein [Sterolibacterium sp.]|nr:GGDEF domain-containing protein [Sterolibacterium sp.]
MLETILKQRSGSWQYEAGGDSHILHVNYLPELKWYLFVEQNESQALSGIRQTLYANLLISVLVTLLILFLAWKTLVRYQQRLEEMASTDELTGLLNRHAYDILIEKMQADCRRVPKPVSFLLVDVDHFKQINDRHGHHLGDCVLTAVTRQLQADLRATDLAVRWGGEEFLLVLWGCDLDEARRIAESLRQKVDALRIPLEDGQKLTVTISIGLARFDGVEAPDHISVAPMPRCIVPNKGGVTGWKSSP